MAKKATKKTKNSAKKTTRKSSGAKRAVEAYEHGDKQRANNPDVGLVTPETDPPSPEPVTYAYDPHVAPELQWDRSELADEIESLTDEGLAACEAGEDADAEELRERLAAAEASLRELKKRREPFLNWAGKAERKTFAVPRVSLHVHERIDPRTILKAVRANGKEDPASGLFEKQLSLFEQPEERPSLANAVDFYSHPHGWTNRLIAGDSLQVMTSLLEKEGMAGQVQMVYFDPPYGIKYGSNFQAFTRLRKPYKSDRDEDLTADPEMIRAFRDTWSLGVHSYASYLQARLNLCRELLGATGSCFLQIGRANLPLALNLMNGVFGSQNRVALIAFQTAPNATAKHLPELFDFLLWYAKDAKNVRTQKLFRERTGSEIDSTFSYSDALGPFKKAQIRESWSKDRLLRAGRIDETGKYAVKRPGDFRYTELSNVWPDTVVSTFSREKVYVVQTNRKVIRRCIAMTTLPGELVLDPTMGGGTTAVSAEELGRRWITCDTSRVAIELAKQRLLTETYNYYELQDERAGITGGLKHTTSRRVTLGSISRNEQLDELIEAGELDSVVRSSGDLETLYDQPLVDNSKVRVTGPFTVEAVPCPTVKSLDEAAETATAESSSEASDAQPRPDTSVAREGATVRAADWRAELLATGVRGKSGQKIELARLEPAEGCQAIHAVGETQPNEDGETQQVAVLFGPDHAPLEQRTVENGWKEAKFLTPKPDLLIYAAFQFDPEAKKDIEELPESLLGFKTLVAQMNTDLLTEDLRKADKKNESFWLVGQPDVLVRRSDAGDGWQVEVRGFDYYDPVKGDVRSGGADQIAMWMLDTDYDDRSLYPRQVFFPMAGKKDGWARLAKTLKAEIDEEKIEAYRGTVSLPFAAGEHRRAAVKIIDDRGIESLKIVNLSDTGD